MNILITGGMGYIGSHACVELLNSGHNIIIYDNLVNSKLNVLDAIEKITGYKPIFERGDLCNLDQLEAVFEKHKIEVVFHFAGLKSVNDSNLYPIKYYDNNVLGTINLLKVMVKMKCKKLVFSSSATVYGNPQTLPIKESSELNSLNPYGSSKLICETIIKDFYNQEDKCSIAILRYFNPVGAHISGLLGENPNEQPSNLMPIITQVALNQRSCLQIYGADYQTSDGTGVRDYIHVVDLAKGHASALEALCVNDDLIIANLGTGEGYSVLQLVNEFESVSGCNIPFEVLPRRKGDVAICYADSSYAERVLGWKAKLSLTDMCKDTWRWAKYSELNQPKK